MTRARFRRVFIVSLAITALLMSVLALSRVTAPRAAHAASQQIDPSYANGQIVYMIGPKLITNPNPQLLAQSEELYLMSFPVDTSCATTSSCRPVTLTSGYQPQCNPCFHPGLPTPFVYHDHLLSGAPGFGTDGTALNNKGPWKIIVMVFNPSYAFSPSFTPITSVAALDAAEGAGDFLPINSGGANQYEFVTGTVLICPLVSSHA